MEIFKYADFHFELNDDNLIHVQNLLYATNHH